MTDKEQATVELSDNRKWVALSIWMAALVAVGFTVIEWKIKIPVKPSLFFLMCVMVWIFGSIFDKYKSPLRTLSIILLILSITFFVQAGGLHKKGTSDKELKKVQTFWQNAWTRYEVLRAKNPEDLTLKEIRELKDLQNKKDLGFLREAETD